MHRYLFNFFTTFLYIMCDLIDKLCMGIHLISKLICFIYPILAYHHLQFVSMISSGEMCITVGSVVICTKMS